MNEQDKNVQNQNPQAPQPEQPQVDQSPPSQPEPAQPAQQQPEQVDVQPPKQEEKVESKAVQEPAKDEKKEKKAKKKKKIPNISKGEGSINLIPPLTETEEKIEVRKFRLNLSAAYTLLFLIVLSIVVLGFNAYQKVTLNAEKEKLFQLEKDLNLRGDLLAYNDEIVRRVGLYNEIEDSTFSSKEVVEYWETTSQGLGEITSIRLTQGLGFEVAGSSTSLSDVAKLWFLLASDERIETVTLDSVVKDGSNARFSFEGVLNLDEFVAAQ